MKIVVFLISPSPLHWGLGEDYIWDNNFERGNGGTYDTKGRYHVFQQNPTSHTKITPELVKQLFLSPTPKDLDSWGGAGNRHC